MTQTTDLTRLSIPFVYIRVIIYSADNERHDIRVGLDFGAGEESQNLMQTLSLMIEVRDYQKD